MTEEKNVATMLVMEKAELTRRIAQIIASHPQHDNIERLMLFGSHVHGTAKPDSDVDLLIEFREPVGYFTLVRIERDISDAIGKPVDLVTVRGLSKYLRPSILASAELVYGER